VLCHTEEEPSHHHVAHRMYLPRELSQNGVASGWTSDDSESDAAQLVNSLVSHYQMDGTCRKTHPERELQRAC
jgi:hypothetical protein